jgi:vitamin B12 transporter
MTTGCGQARPSVAVTQVCVAARRNGRRGIVCIPACPDQPAVRNEPWAKLRPKTLGTGMKKTLFAASACALALTGGAFAQQAESEAATKLDRIMITTPLRRASSLERSTSSVAVIGEKEIRQSAAPDLSSLLKSYAGVSVNSNGGIGSTTGVGLRGAKAEQTLVLVNGVRVSSATSGSVSLFNIPLSSIERIEVAKGAHSAQYGADAIGGIINIITKSGGVCANGNSSCTTVTTGLMHPWGGTVSASHAGQTADGVDYSFGGSVFGTQGYDFTTPNNASNEPDDDGFKQGSLNYSLSKEFDWGGVYSNGLISRARTQYDNKPGPFDPVGLNETEADTLAGKIGVRLDHSESWNSTFEANASSDNATNFRKDVTSEDKFNSTRFGILASTEKSFETETANHIVSVGTEAYREKIDSTGTFTLKQRDLAALFTQYSFEYGALNLDAGLRYDYNEQFGDATTYNLGVSYAVLPELTVRAAYGTGFRAPSFNDLYFQQSFGIGNPNLRPEWSRSYEVGLNWHPTDATNIDMAFYQNWVKDQIAWDTTLWPMQPFNLDRVSTTGFEAAVNHRFNDRLTLRASVDVRKPINDMTDLYVVRQDLLKTSAEIEFQATEKLFLKAGVFYVGKRYANVSNTQKLPSYTTIDFTGVYKLDEQSELKLSVENLFDERYERIPNYYSMGRTVNLSFSRTF